LQAATLAVRTEAEKYLLLAGLNLPLYQGVLRLLAGPHQVEGGWWHRLGEGSDVTTGHVQRATRTQPSPIR
jgi:hypothetical protein